MIKIEIRNMSNLDDDPKWEVKSSGLIPGQDIELSIDGEIFLIRRYGVHSYIPKSKLEEKRG